MIGKWFLSIVCPKKFWGTLNKAAIQKLVEQLIQEMQLSKYLQKEKRKKKLADPLLWYQLL